MLYQLPAIRGLAISRSTGKSGAKSSELREEGNKEFQGGSLRKALARWAGGKQEQDQKEQEQEDEGNGVGATYIRCSNKRGRSRRIRNRSSSRNSGKCEGVVWNKFPLGVLRLS